MKVTEEQHEVHTSGNLIEVAASIKATSRAFHVLSNNLYSDKILAIVRELSCNAWDSHVSAGKNDLPIDVHLPTVLDPTFFVRDFGLGMSDFDIRGGYVSETGERVPHEEGQGKAGYEPFNGIYTTFFDSTKTDTNDVIGQLGLGSKSPYAYAHTFTVESRFNGVKYLYTCYKNAKNEPSITLMSQVATDEENGMTISMAVKVADIEKFAQAAKKALMYFKPTPNILGKTHVTPYGVHHTLTGTNWKVRNADYYAHMNGAYVVQGFVPYPIDVDQLEQNGISTIASKLGGTDLDLYVQIGDVEVAPSREALSYDQRTINNLIRSLKAAAEELRTSFDVEFAKCESQWDVAMQFDRYDAAKNDKLRELFRALHKDKPFEWEGQAITRAVKFDFSDVKHSKLIRAHVKDQRGAGKLKIDGEWHTHDGMVFSFDLNGNTHVFIDSRAMGTNSKIAMHLKTLPEKDGRTPSALILRPVARSHYRIEEMLEMIQSMGNPPFTYVDTLPDSPKTSRAYSSSPRARKVLNQSLKWAGFRTKKGRWGSTTTTREFYKSCWAPITLDLSLGGFYVPIDKSSVLKPSGSFDYHIDTLIGAAKGLGFIKDTDPIIGFTARELLSIDKTKWKNLYEHIQAAFTTQLVDTLELTKQSTATELRRQLPGHLLSWFCDSYQLSRIVDGEFCTLLTEITSLLEVKTYPFDHANHIQNRFNIVLPEDTRPQLLLDRWNDVTKRYKHLTMVSWGSGIDERKRTAIIDYVNEVDNKPQDDV